eukprot:2374402-Rhodomonas_salina.3
MADSALALAELAARGLRRAAVHRDFALCAATGVPYSTVTSTRCTRRCKCVHRDVTVTVERRDHDGGGSRSAPASCHARMERPRHVARGVLRLVPPRPRSVWGSTGALGVWGFRVTVK